MGFHMDYVDNWTELNDDNMIMITFTQCFMIYKSI